MASFSATSFLKNATKGGLGPSLSILMSLSVLTGHIALQYYEGINVQFIFSPFLLFLIFKIDDILELKISKTISIISSILVLLFSFGEAIQIFAVFNFLSPSVYAQYPVAKNYSQMDCHFWLLPP